MSKKLPKAKDFLYEEIDYQRYDRCLEKDIIKALKKFAKLHAKAQAKAICEKVKMIDIGSPNPDGEWMPCNLIDKNSIIDAYPLTNIK